MDALQRRLCRDDTGQEHHPHEDDRATRLEAQLKREYEPDSGYRQARGARD